MGSATVRLGRAGQGPWGEGWAGLGLLFMVAFIILAAVGLQS